MCQSKCIGGFCFDRSSQRSPGFIWMMHSGRWGSRLFSFLLVSSFLFSILCQCCEGTLGWQYRQDDSKVCAGNAEVLKMMSVYVWGADGGRKWTWREGQTPGLCGPWMPCFHGQWPPWRLLGRAVAWLALFLSVREISQVVVGEWVIRKPDKVQGGEIRNYCEKLRQETWTRVKMGKLYWGWAGRALGRSGWQDWERKGPAARWCQAFVLEWGNRANAWTGAVFWGKSCLWFWNLSSAGKNIHIKIFHFFW